MKSKVVIIIHQALLEKKILGVSILYGKNVVIVVCGFQEQEAVENFKLFNYLILLPTKKIHLLL